MDIHTSHVCNLLSLQLIAAYFEKDPKLVESYYHELAGDHNFLKAVNGRIDACRDLYPKGLFLHKDIDSIDWFGNQRVALYVLIRLLKPRICLETGVFYGGTTAFILNALQKNGEGRLVSIDLPGKELQSSGQKRHDLVGDSEIIPDGLSPGFIVPDYLKPAWQLVLGDSLEEIGKIDFPIDFYSHDSEHSHRFVFQEMALAKTKMAGNGVMMADDINWSNGFFEFVTMNKLHPLLLTDNGKFNLTVRLGVVKLDHPKNGIIDFTG